VFSVLGDEEFIHTIAKCIYNDENHSRFEDVYVFPDNNMDIEKYWTLSTNHKYHSGTPITELTENEALTYLI